MQQTTIINIFSFVFQRKLDLMFQVNPGLLSRQRIHMKNQALFSSKDKSKKLKCRLYNFCLAFFSGKNLVPKSANEA